MNIHILGICGTFMGGLAALARSLDYEVSGSDKNVYPPMSTQLEQLGIEMHQGYDDSVLQQPYDEVIVGNVMTRGMPVIESLLKSHQHYISGPQWLGEHLLRHKKVYAVAGTHGKTTTSSMLSWILDSNGHNPGFLIGGVAENFGISARNTDTESFVIEADEYDSAFFDKRSKFVHYHADVAILNNLEFDHADIFDDLKSIQKQFHHLIRTIPENGVIVYNHEDNNLAEVIAMGCWSHTLSFGSSKDADIWALPLKDDYSHFDIYFQGKKQATIEWHLTGKHNMLNAIAAICAALQEGIKITDAAESLMTFKGIKRRMELIGQAQNITIFDDFAHHPTAIATTIEGIKNKIGNQKLVAICEPRSNSMRAGAHAAALPCSLIRADISIVMNYPHLSWDHKILEKLSNNGVQLVTSIDELLQILPSVCTDGSHVIFMSNGSFENAPRRFLQQLSC